MGAMPSYATKGSLTQTVFCLSLGQQDLRRRCIAEYDTLHVARSISGWALDEVCQLEEHGRAF